MKDYPFLLQLDARIPGFLNDLQPLMAVSEQLIAVVPDTEFKRAVNGQIDVAIEHYGKRFRAASRSTSAKSL